MNTGRLDGKTMAELVISRAGYCVLPKWIQGMLGLWLRRHGLSMSQARRIQVHAPRREGALRATVTLDSGHLVVPFPDALREDIIATGDPSELRW